MTWYQWMLWGLWVSYDIWTLAEKTNSLWNNVDGRSTRCDTNPGLWSIAWIKTRYERPPCDCTGTHRNVMLSNQNTSHLSFRDCLNDAVVMVKLQLSCCWTKCLLMLSNLSEIDMVSIKEIPVQSRYLKLFSTIDQLIYLPCCGLAHKPGFCFGVWYIGGCLAKGRMSSPSCPKPSRGSRLERVGLAMGQPRCH